MTDKPVELPSAKAEQEPFGELARRLLLLSEKALSSEDDDNQSVEQYALALSVLEERIAEISEHPEIIAVLKELESSHEKVMNKVASDKLKIKHELGSLKKKGKIVITYTDQLPKRISLSTTKKV